MPSSWRALLALCLPAYGRSQDCLLADCSQDCLLEDCADMEVSLLQRDVSFMPRSAQEISAQEASSSPAGVSLALAARDMLHAAPAAACMELEAALLASPSGKKTPFGASAPTMEVLETGVAESAAQGVLLLMESEEDKSSPDPAALPCWNVLLNLGVQYDPERSLLVAQTTPHLWDAVVAMNKRVRSSHDGLRMAVVMFAGIFGRPPSDATLLDMDRAGGFEMMFDVLDKNRTDLVVAQAAWAGLSDNVENTRVGAELAADHGGKNAGLAFLVELLKEYRGKHAFQPFMPYGLRYESVHDINGILMHDDAERSWRDVAVAHGFMEEALLAMREEPDDYLTLENGCEALYFCTKDRKENMARLRDLGGLETVLKAIKDKKRVVNDYHLLNSCSAALLPFAQGADLQLMLKQGLKADMEEAMPLWEGNEERTEPWRFHFPWANVQELHRLLNETA